MCALKRGKLKQIHARLIAINIKSNSTIVCLYEGEENIFTENIWYSNQEMKQCSTTGQQVNLRYKSILEVLKSKKLYTDEIEGIVCKGCLIEKCSSGTYVVDHNLKASFSEIDLNAKFTEEQLLIMGPLIAYEFYEKHHVNGYMINTVNIDEMIPVAKYTGIESIKRDSFFNALTQKSVAKRFCDKHGKRYDEINLIVAYLGNRITVGAHKNGKVIDVNNIAEGEGPFSPERAGSIPITELLKMCFSGNLTYEEIEEFMENKGGCVAYFDNSDFRVLVDSMQKGNDEAELLFNAMAYNICKEIGRCAVALEGHVYAILLTGRIAHCRAMVDYIKNKVVHLAPVHVYAGKEEMTNLVEEALRVIRGEEKEKICKTHRGINEKLN